MLRQYDYLFIMVIILIIWHNNLHKNTVIILPNVDLNNSLEERLKDILEE